MRGGYTRLGVTRDRVETHEEDGGEARKVAFCEIKSYLHSAGFELLVKQRAVGAPSSFPKCLTKVRTSA